MVFRSQEEVEKRIAEVKAELRAEFPERSIVQHRLCDKKMVVIGYQPNLNTPEASQIICQSLDAEKGFIDGLFNRFSLKIFKED